MINKNPAIQLRSITFLTHPVASKIKPNNRCPENQYWPTATRHSPSQPTLLILLILCPQHRFVRHNLAVVVFSSGYMPVLVSLCVFVCVFVVHRTLVSSGDGGCWLLARRWIFRLRIPEMKLGRESSTAWLTGWLVVRAQKTSPRIVVVVLLILISSRSHYPRRDAPSTMRRYSRIQLLPLNPSRINREQRDPPSSRNLLLLFYDDSAAATPVFRARPTTFEQPMIPIVTPSVSRSSKCSKGPVVSVLLVQQRWLLNKVGVAK